MEARKVYTAGGAIPRTYDHNGVQHTYWAGPSMSDISPNAPIGYGRMAGGTREAEVDYIASQVMAEMVRAGMPQIADATTPAVPSSKALPKPYQCVVGSLLRGLRWVVGVTSEILFG
jgi:hypothetical protein